MSRGHATGTATAPPPGVGRDGPARSVVEAALAPVADAILVAARARAARERAAAEQEASAELANARSDAERLLADARAEGARAAAELAASELVTARRESREALLAARRLAYETLRRAAVESLERRASTPEGRRLAERTAALVRERVGVPATAPETVPDSLVALAELGNRRAELGPAALVDWALGSLAAEVERLWA